MWIQRDGMSNVCLVSVMTMLIMFASCKTKNSVNEKAKTSDNQTAETVTVKQQYANDLDRLSEISERINRVCGKGYVFVFGSQEPSVANNTISIDYSLFDRLNDDGSAVLISEAIASRLNPISKGSSQANIESTVLRADELAGRYVKLAGFKEKGFSEWLKLRKNYFGDTYQDKIPEEMRIAAFLRGYLTGNSRK